MALGKYTRIDGRKSPGYWSTVAVVAFVSLCLVGIWMTTTSSPSTVTPAETIDVHHEKQKPEMKKDVVKENPGDLPKNATNGDSNVNKNEGQGPQQERNEAETEGNKAEETETESGSSEGKVESDESEKKTEENPVETNDDEKKDEVVERKPDNESDISSNKDNGQSKEQDSQEVYPSGAQSELLNETKTQNGAFSTQVTESKNHKEIQRSSEEPKKQEDFAWKLCNTTAGPDYIPCLDNWNGIYRLKTTMHFEHRERHCPTEPPTCLVPLPEGYRRPIEWPTSREKIWYYNVPHAKLAKIKGHQNWVKITGEFLTFPGGGTQFQHGALHYINAIQKMLPDVAWGKNSRVVLDVGCGVASFGGFLFERDVITMSFAPKDEHEAQVQFALERGIPAISAVMGTQRLPFPATVFDVVHCARCRVPWHIQGGKLLLELNRVLRPGGFFIWSATPVYLKLQEDVKIWEAMSELTKQMCWKLVKKERDVVNKVGIAIYQKPSSNECYEQRARSELPLCSESDDPSAAWKVPLRTCMHKIPIGELERGSQWPEQWSARLEKVPYWLTSSQAGVYGKPAPKDFNKDYEHWKHVVSQSYINGMGINWSNVRNVMDMRAVYGGFAAALRDMKVWVMNVISVDAPDTLPVIYERGLIGIYHDWCESFSTYPRSYDLLHADHLFSKIKKRCNIQGLVVEVDRILRPEGKIIVRDNMEIITELQAMFGSMHWEIRMTYSKDSEGFLCAQKTIWRPKAIETLEYAIMCPGDKVSKKRGLC